MMDALVIMAVAFAGLALATKWNVGLKLAASFGLGVGYLALRLALH
jgi:hypothetical protein